MLENVSKPKAINFDIEALRGFAALFVVWDHANGFKNMLDPAYSSSGLLAYVPSGHFCVLLFFVLSGYVIGLSNKKPLTWATTGNYLRKRAVRLYPIYAITLLLAVVASIGQFSAGTIVGNFALMQELLVDDINQPSWSLHYEVLYYLLFILISIYRTNAYVIALLCVPVALVNMYLFPVMPTIIISSYAYGFLFWILGLLMSQRLARAADDTVPARVLLSCIFFVLCIDQFNVLDTLLHKVVQAAGISLSPTLPADIRWGAVAIRFFDLAYLPAALIIILIFTGKWFPRKRLLLQLLIGVSAINLLYVSKHLYAGDLDVATYGLPTVFMVLALVCLYSRGGWLERLGQHAVALGIRLGGLSYGIYLVHYPLLMLFRKVHFFSGTWQTYVVRFGLLIALTLLLAYVLEEVLQPRLKHRMLGASTKMQPISA